MSSNDAQQDNIQQDNTQQDNTQQDDTQGMAQTSFFSNLKNKITYKVNKAVYEPEANKYSKQKKTFEKKEDKKEKKKEEDEDSTDPDKISVKRIIKNTAKKFSETFSALIYPFLALMVTMLVTNELMMYSIPIRIIIFIVTLGLCLFVPIYTIILAIAFSLKALYAVYINTTKPESEHIPYLPTIFALLPTKLTEPESKLGRAFAYPFTYPKTEVGQMKLPQIMTNYEKELQESFKEFDKYKSMPMFSKLISKVHNYLIHLHDKPVLKEIV